LASEDDFFRREDSLAMHPGERQSLKYICQFQKEIAFGAFGHDRLRAAFCVARKI
jgi:hypothetical protein